MAGLGGTNTTGTPAKSPKVWFIAVGDKALAAELPAHSKKWMQLTIG